MDHPTPDSYPTDALQQELSEHLRGAEEPKSTKGASSGVAMAPADVFGMSMLPSHSVGFSTDIAAPDIDIIDISEPLYRGATAVASLPVEPLATSTSLSRSVLAHYPLHIPTAGSDVDQLDDLLDSVLPQMESPSGGGPPRMSPFADLEITHLECRGDALKVRECAEHTLCELDCVVQKGNTPWCLAAEVFVHYEATSFHVSMYAGQAEGTVLLEFQKRQGCSMAFCNTFRAFARRVRTIVVRDNSGFMDGPDPPAAGMAADSELAVLSLPTDPTERDTCLSPIKTLVHCEWSDAQREGCRLTARLADNDANVKALVASKLVRDMAEKLDALDRHTVRCAAAAIANMARALQCYKPPVAVVQLFRACTPLLEAAMLRSSCPKTRSECERASRNISALQ